MFIIIIKILDYLREVSLSFIESSNFEVIVTLGRTAILII